MEHKKSIFEDKSNSHYLQTIHKKLSVFNKGEQSNCNIKEKDKKLFELELLVRRQKLEGTLNFFFYNFLILSFRN
jgi:hypothetical protein